MSRIEELVRDSELMTAAVAKATREAVLQHARAGQPVATWRDGKVVWLSPEEIFARCGCAPSPTVAPQANPPLE